MTGEPGVYQLHLQLPKAACIKVGKLGVFLFPAGRYIYTGSALNGLEQRLSRHRRSHKPLHWHIDYLLRYACIEHVTTLRTRQRLECALNRTALEYPGAQVIARGFGSSDCRCATHLVYLPPLTRLGDDERSSVNGHSLPSPRLWERRLSTKWAGTHRRWVVRREPVPPSPSLWERGPGGEGRSEPAQTGQQRRKEEATR